jgi:hypothetical protein
MFLLLPLNHWRGRGEEGSCTQGRPSQPCAERCGGGGGRGRRHRGRERRRARGKPRGRGPTERAKGEEGPALTGKRKNPRCNNGGGSLGKMKFARAEHKFTDWGRTIGWIDESKAPGRSSRRDERNGTLNSTDDAWIKCNCSLELLSKMEPSQTSASNFGSFPSNLRMGFRILERARREDSSHIYIAKCWGSTSSPKVP